MEPVPSQLFIDSGIAVSISPTTAAVPTLEQQPFFAILTNDLQNKGVTWSLTQTTPSSTTPTTPNAYAALPTCTVSGNATGCGSIDANGVYTAPAVVPSNPTVPTTVTTTPQNVTIVATSVEDPTRFALGTITITTGGPITFNGITPTIAPQGAAYWDIYLNAPNLSSASIITLTDANNGKTTLTSGSNQIKVLFPIPTGTVANPPSSGARLRLFSNNLTTTGPVTISITDPSEPVTTTPGGVFTYNIMPVRPTSLASYPTDILQGGTPSGNIGLTVDGGYFGLNGQLANVIFQGNTIPGVTNGQGQPLSNPKQLQVQLPSGAINTGLPGLYSLSVARTSPPLPFTNNPSVTDLAVFPNYSTNPPVLLPGPIAAGTNPSAIGIDQTLGVAAVVETGSNAVQFYTIGSGTLTPLGGPVACWQCSNQSVRERHQPHCRGHQLSGSEHNGSADSGRSRCSGHPVHSRYFRRAARPGYSRASALFDRCRSQHKHGSRGLFLDLRFVRSQSRVPRELEYRNQSLRMFDFRCHGSLPLCSGHSKHGGLPASRYGP